MIDILNVRVKALLACEGKEVVKILDREPRIFILDSAMSFYDVEKISKSGVTWRGFELQSHSIIWRL